MRGNASGDLDSRVSNLQTKPTDLVPEIIGDDLPPALLEVKSYTVSVAIIQSRLKPI